MRITKTEIITIFSIITPYLFILFFLRLTDIFTFIGLLFFCSLFLLGCLTVLLLTKRTKYLKKYYLLAAALSVVILFFFKSEIVNIGDNVFFLLHKSRMSEVVIKIEDARKQNKQIEIPQLYFAEVDTLEGGVVIFTLEGFLDNCVGIAFSNDNRNPGYTNCGRIVKWKKLDDHWYLWYTS